VNLRPRLHDPYVRRAASDRRRCASCRRADATAKLASGACGRHSRACWQQVSCIVRTPRQSARAEATPKLAGGARPGAARTSLQSSPTTLADAMRELVGGAGRRHDRALGPTQRENSPTRWRTPRQSAQAALADATAERAGGAGASVHGQHNES
jgi:hypothetical protein